MNPNKKQLNMQEYFGIVVIIDALGVSNYTINDCRKLVYDLEEINFEKDKFLESFASESEKYEWIGAQTVANTMKKVKTSQFGDTIILAFPIENDYNCENLTAIYFIAVSFVLINFNGLIP